MPAAQAESSVAAFAFDGVPKLVFDLDRVCIMLFDLIFIIFMFL
jgi:hypothetical protein